MKIILDDFKYRKFEKRDCYFENLIGSDCGVYAIASTEDPGFILRVGESTGLLGRAKSHIEYFHKLGNRAVINPTVLWERMSLNIWNAGYSLIIYAIEGRLYSKKERLDAELRWTRYFTKQGHSPLNSEGRSQEIYRIANELLTDQPKYWRAK